MFWIQWQWKLRRLQRERQAVTRDFCKKHEEARKQKKSREERAGIQMDELHWLNEIDDQMEYLASSFLLEATQRLFLPIPEYSPENGAWEQLRSTGQHVLTRDAMAKLRSAIRQEKRDRREGAIAWMTALAGVIGMLTGLIAVWGSK